MDSFDYNDSSSVRYLHQIDGIQFDGRSYALYDPNFKINDSFTINFQVKTLAHDGLILWIGDPLPDSSFTIEIQNRQLVARCVVHGHPYSVRTNFTKNRLCDDLWHYVQIRLDGSLLSMKIDKRQYSKTEARVHLVDMRGPLFLGGYSEKYFPPFLSVRTKEFFHGNLRNIKINDKQIDYLAPRHSTVVPEFYHFTSTVLSSNNDRSYPNSPAVIKRTFETTKTTSAND